MSAGRVASAVALVLWLFAATNGGVIAHELRPAFLSLTEISPGLFAVVFKTPMRGDMRLSLSVALSGQNQVLGAVSSQQTGDALIQNWRMNALDPVPGQVLTIAGLDATMTDALVRVEYLDGASWTERLTPSQPSRAIPAAQSRGAVAMTFVRHGLEHILFGLDHLLFVAALMLIVRSRAALVKTITAFTIAHSLTLTLSTFDLVSLPAAPVEAAIALSVVFVAAEIVRMQRGEASLTSRSPWLVAFAFGLLHGFGFAAALTHLGLPHSDLPLALLAFNVGVEIGQLVFVAGLAVAIAAVRRMFPLPASAIYAPAYAIGIVASLWFAVRIDAVFFK